MMKSYIPQLPRITLAVMTICLMPIVGLVIPLVSYVTPITTIILVLIGSCLCLGLIIWASRATWRPAIVLAAVIPFQGMLVAYLGFFANLFTLLVILVFFANFPASQLSVILFASRVQKLSFVFIATLSIGIVLSLQYTFDVDIFINYGQNLILFFVVAVIASALKKTRHLRLVIGSFLISTAIYYLMSIADFYFGISFLPHIANPQDMEAFIKGEIIQDAYINNYRLRGVANTLPINRFALLGVISLLFIPGYLSEKSPSWYKSILWPIAIILSFGVLASGSRAAVFGLIAGLLVLLTNRELRLKMAPFLIVSVVIGSISSIYGVSELLINRFSADELSGGSGRFTTWSFGLELFLSSPLIGVGVNGFANQFIARGLDAPSAAAAHNSYIDILSSGGIVAGIPFLVLISHVISVFLYTPSAISTLGIWRHVFLAGFVAILVICIFNSYHYERVFWLIIAAAAALESSNHIWVMEPFH